MNSDKAREIRKYLYAVLVAAGPLLSFYGIASENEVALWLGLGGTLLGVPAGTTALSNLNPKTGVTVPEVGVQNVDLDTEDDPDLDDPEADPEVLDEGDPVREGKHVSEV